MKDSLSRRHFIAGLTAIAAGTTLPLDTLAALVEPPLYPPVDLSYFEKPIRPAPAEILFGYASITWAGNDLQAIKDISEVGFQGIQLRSNILPEFGERPQALRTLLEQYRLELVALSSGGVRITPGTEAEEVAKHTRHAKFVRDVGGHYLQVTDSARPKDRAPTTADFKELGHRLTEIGKRTSDLGIKLGYHNHMNSLGESPDEVDQIMASVDRRYVKLELDIAHYQQGGGNPAEAIKRYGKELLFLHIKDVESLESAEQPGRKYRFVELGRGRVNMPEVFSALKEVNFRGWAIIELDSVTAKDRSAKESALISKKYIEEELKLKIAP